MGAGRNFAACNSTEHWDGERSYPPEVAVT